jgi:hypothetical protein
MSNKIFCLALVAMLLVLGFPAEGQQTAKIPRIGWLAAGSPSGVAPLTDAFRQVCVSWAMLREKISPLSFAMRKGNSIVFPILRQRSFISRLM